MYRTSMASPPAPSTATSEVYKHVYPLVLDFLAVRQVYDGLYGPAGDVALLNRIAGQTFGLVQRLFRDDLLLRAAKLFDTDKRAASLPNLIHAIRRDGLTPLANALHSQMPPADLRERIRQHRSKRVAHDDLDVRTGVVTLPALLLKDITGAATAAHAVIDVYEREVNRSSLAKVVLLPPKGGPHALLKRLAEAEEYRREHPDYWMKKPLQPGPTD